LILAALARIPSMRVRSTLANRQSAVRIGCSPRFRIVFSLDGVAASSVFAL
jgi:hypothetical protein